MGETTGISWTDATFNPWLGCAKVSPACDHCYAEQGSKRLAAQHGLKLWEGDRYFTSDAYWKQPAKWNRAAGREGVQRRVFCASYADVFEGRADLDVRRQRLWDVIESTPSLTWQLLTKRPENIRSMVPPWWLVNPRTNVWYGTTAETQEWLNVRVAILQNVPAVIRFLSIEPQLERMTLDRVFGLRPGAKWLPCLCDEIDPSDHPCLTCDGRRSLGARSGIHWVIVGGESGPRARPFDIGWVRRLRDECHGAGVAIFVKQLGANVHDDVSGLRLTLRDSHGGDWDEWPADLRVREFPAA